jgi:hypothetical protein
VTDDISRRLREAAEAHHPDRARILARLQRGTTTATAGRRPPGIRRTLGFRRALGTARSPGVRRGLGGVRIPGVRRGFGGVRPAGAAGIGRSWPKVALAVAGVLAVAGLSLGRLLLPPTPQPNSAATSTAPVPTGSVAPTTRATASSVPPAPGRVDPPTGGGTPTPPADRTSDGPLSSAGSVDPHSTVYWAQSGLTLTATAPLTALTVELRIAQTGGVRSTGQWQTDPADDYTVTVTDTGGAGAVVYRWELKPGRTVPAGQHVFAAQYNHAAGPRDPAADGYEARATTPDGPHQVRGPFTPPR